MAGKLAEEFERGLGVGQVGREEGEDVGVAVFGAGGEGVGVLRSSVLVGEGGFGPWG